MKRRTFLNQMGYGVPASLAFSSILTSCQKNRGDDDIPTDNRFKNYKVLVVGAGASGLYTAWYLNERGFNVTVLEASDEFGGRIKSVSGFADYDIELGAERIYGSNTPWFNMITESGFALNGAQPENYFFFRQDGSDINEPPLKNRALSNQYSDFNQAMEFIQNAKNFNGADISLEAAFATTGLWNMAGVVNGLIGNRQGTNNTRLGMKGYAQEQEALTATPEEYILKNQTLKDVLANQFSSIIDQIEFNAVVSKIDYAGEMIEVTKQNGQTILADRVIVTVPLTTLKNEEIYFSPGLPTTKIDALNKLDMKSGMKVHLKFSTPFWEDLVTANLGSIFGHNFLPEIYISSLGRSEIPVISICVMGERAEQFSSMGDSVVNVMLSYLDEIFSSQIPTQSFVQGGYQILDWSKEPFINGAYSYPLVGGGLVFRKELAEPMDNKIFFAGEATHFSGHSGTVHGAIETGIRVTQEVEASVA